MRTWAKLTDEQRTNVVSMVVPHGEDFADAAKAYEAARVVLLTAREEQITADAIADACEECGIHEHEAAEDAPSFIRRLYRERNEARDALSALRSSLREGILTLQSFRCQHDPPCSEAPSRGGCCNSCWARSWAEDVRLP